MALSPTTFPCPKCGRILAQSGEMMVEADGAAIKVPVFQCDECLMTVDFLGEKEEVALTFAVGADGKPFDPASEDGTLDLGG
jgi:hypothetical protein